MAELPWPPPWAGPGARAPLTVADVRERAARFPSPVTRSLGHVIEPEKIRESETLVLVVDCGGEAGLVVTQRPSTMKFHRDDWVFPGGRIDAATDHAPGDAARREGEEELGLPRSQYKIVAALDSHGPVATGFVMHPFLAVAEGDVTLAPDPHEVAEALVLPLSHLMADGNCYLDDKLPAGLAPGPMATTGTTGPPPDRPAGPLRPFFVVRDDQRLWGVQGNILWNLLEHLTS